MHPDRCVYLIRGCRSGLIKIGWSENPGVRAATISYAAREPVELLVLFPGGTDDERALHRYFDPERTFHAGTREWFYPSATLLDWIAARPASERVVGFRYEPTHQTKTRGPARTQAQVRADYAAQDRRRAAFLARLTPETRARWLAGVDRHAEANRGRPSPRRKRPESITFADGKAV